MYGSRWGHSRMVCNDGLIAPLNRDITTHGTPLKAWATPALRDLPRKARGTPSLAGAYGRYSAAIRAHTGVLGASANMKLVNTPGPWTQTPVAAAHLHRVKCTRVAGDALCLFQTYFTRGGYVSELVHMNDENFPRSAALTGVISPPTPRYPDHSAWVHSSTHGPGLSNATCVFSTDNARPSI